MSINVEMAEWSKLCRGCMGKTPLVHIYDDSTNIRAKYHEITTIMVSEGDGLPEFLCLDCLDTLNYAHQFKKKCLQVEAELKLRLATYKAKKKKRSFESDDSENLKSKKKASGFSAPGFPFNTVIKMEDMSDEDDYYVVVIDEEKDGSKTVKAIKMEDEHNPDDVPNEVQIKQEQIQDEEIYGTYDVDQPFSGTEAFLQVEESAISVMHSPQKKKPDRIQTKLRAVEVTPESIFVENSLANATQFIDGSNDPESEKIDFIQVLTDAEIVDGNIIEYEDGSGMVTSDTVDIAVTEDGVAYTQEEVVVSNGDENLEQLNCDATEFVIDYEGDEDEAITVYQQEDGSFLCFCGNAFMDFSDYEKHRASHNLYTCFACNKGFESKEILTGHTLLHENTDAQLSCPFCEQTVRRNALTSHIKINHNRFRPTCDLCEKSFASENNLKRHMLIHAGVKHYECDVCPKRFNQKIAMQNHRATHGDYSTLKCSDCLKEFESEDVLAAHKKEWCEGPSARDPDAEDERHVCKTCGKEYVTAASLRSHVEYVHSSQQTELLCSECGEVLPTRKAMYAHSYTHRQTKTKHLKRFSCNTCGKGCASHAMLLMHERVHTNERPFKCNNCSLAFKTKTHLTTHQLTHTQEKRFGCSVCMKFFALKGNLVVHLRTHTGERPYVCTICNQAFIDSKYLKKHKLRRHEIGNIPWNHYY